MMPYPLITAVAVAVVACVQGSLLAQRSAPASQPASAPTTAAAVAAVAAVDPWEKDIAAFEAEDRAAPTAPGATIFYGSSSIRFWRSLKTDFADRTVLNRGFGGSRMDECARYFDRAVLRLRPSTIVIYAGDNDMAAGRSPEQVAADFEALVKKTRDALPEARIAYLAIKPSPARWHLQSKMTDANDRIRAFAQTDPQRLAYIDIVTPMLGSDGQPRPELYMADKLHMTPAGYAVWRPLVEAALKGMPAAK